MPEKIDASKNFKLKVINEIEDKEQTVAGSKVFDELGNAIEDVPADENWTEEVEGEIAPLENAGKTENEVSDDMRKRFALTHEEAPETMVTGKKSSGKHDFAKTDTPADTNKETY